MFAYEGELIRRAPYAAQDAFRERQRRRAQAQLSVDEQFRLENLMSRDHLYRSAVSLQEFAGDSPGPNSIRMSELTRSELGNMACALATQISNKTYVPGPRRAVSIEKQNGGMRTLQIPNVEDKVVARRLKDVLEPLFAPMFVDESFGFRRRCGGWQMLARLKTHCDRNGQYVFVVCDVQRAFDSMSIEEIMCAFVELMEDSKLRQCSSQTVEDLLELIALVLMGGKSRRPVGIDTGCPFSPLALNLLLHVNHDLIFMNQTNKPLWVRETVGQRYADNLIYRASDGTEGRQVCDNLRRHFLGINLPLKADAEVYDLKCGAKAPSAAGGNNSTGIRQCSLSTSSVDENAVSVLGELGLSALGDCSLHGFNRFTP